MLNVKYKQRWVVGWLVYNKGWLGRGLEFFGGQHHSKIKVNEKKVSF